MTCLELKVVSKLIQYLTELFYYIFFYYIIAILYEDLQKSLQVGPDNMECDQISFIFKHSPPCVPVAGVKCRVNSLSLLTVVPIFIDGRDKRKKN